ncbi:MAG: ribonuclease H-like domain-containing protein [Candidatus Poribacteria bacterium]
MLSFTPSQVLFLDIETTGLSNSPLFLVGIMYFTDTDKGEPTFKIGQLFARDYSEEISLLHYLNELFANFAVFATFNGLSFDIPFIRNRMIYHRIEPQIDHFHFDILHHSRRKWRGQVPNCKLQTLETHICNRRRIGDIPSDLIPDAYHEFVKTGDTLLLKEIFQHNALDLITMAELIVALRT